MPGDVDVDNDLLDFYPTSSSKGVKGGDGKPWMVDMNYVSVIEFGGYGRDFVDT